MLTGYHTNQSLVHASKPLGAYLIEAGLLNEAQVGVALADQDMTALPFGEIVVTRGWVKEQTIEYLMQKVILPERQSRESLPPDLESALIRQRLKTTGQYPVSVEQASRPAEPVRRTEKASRPMNPRTTTPPETHVDEDGVNWIG